MLSAKYPHSCNRHAALVFFLWWLLTAQCWLLSASSLQKSAQGIAAALLNFYCTPFNFAISSPSVPMRSIFLVNGEDLDVLLVLLGGIVEVEARKIFQPDYKNLKAQILEVI